MRPDLLYFTVSTERKPKNKKKQERPGNKVNPTTSEKKRCSQHQTLFLTRAGRVWARDYSSIIYSTTCRYTHAEHVPHAEHMESSIGQNSKCGQDAYLANGSASEANQLGADAQVVSCHGYLVGFHPFVEQLTVFYTSGLALALSSVLQVLGLDLHHNGIMSITCQKGM